MIAAVTSTPNTNSFNYRKTYLIKQETLISNHYEQKDSTHFHAMHL